MFYLVLTQNIVASVLLKKQGTMKMSFRIMQMQYNNVANTYNITKKKCFVSTIYWWSFISC